MSWRLKQSPRGSEHRRVEPTGAWGLRIRRFVPAVVGTLIALSSNAEALQVNTEYAGFRRLMPGGTRAEIEAAQALGFQTFLTQQLNHTALPHVEGTAFGGPPGVDDYWPLVNDQPLEIANAINPMGGLDQEDMRAFMRYARIWRWVYSGQGLYETMTWEWDRHFNIDQRKRAGWMLFPYWNRVVTRKHAFGQFRELLIASTGENSDRAAAMIHYLDSLANACVNPNEPVNENYGRELPELHAMGTDPQPFGEDDVRALSKILSGRIFDPGVPDPNPMMLPPDPQDYGMVLFDPGSHCAQDRIFLNVNLTGSATTNSQALAAINLMVDKTRAGIQFCPEFIARKLVAALLTDAPAQNATHQAILDGAVADAVTAFGQDGDIKAMISAILTDANIDGILSPVGNDRPLYKYMEPVKFVTSLLRASEATLEENNMGPISEVLTGLAERPYAYSPPIGYPTEIEAWVQDQPGRWEFAYSLFEEVAGGGDYCTIDGVSVDVDALYNQLTPSGFDVFNCGAQVNEILTGGNLNVRDALILQLYADRVRTNGLYTNDEIKWRVLALGAMAPSYSLY